MSQSNTSYIKTKSPKRNTNEQQLERKAKLNKPARNNTKRQWQDTGSI